MWNTPQLTDLAAETQKMVSEFLKNRASRGAQHQYQCSAYSLEDMRRNISISPASHSLVLLYSFVLRPNLYLLFAVTVQPSNKI